MTEAAGAGGGTVTVLFTDIEGSTQLELAVGTARYAALRERHRELLRAAFAAHRGDEQSTAGDSFFVVFGHAAEAVAAAADAQRALAAESWPPDGIVRVRMGMNSGDVTMAGGDLVGYTINRAARVTGVAAGGQIVLSEATRALVVDDLPPGLSLRDLGEHRLKDLRAPERLTQVDVDGLPSDFPTLRSIDTRPNNLPTQLTSFIGRDTEVAEALGLLRSTRLLTLIGPGGIGKTRLSLQIAAAAADGFPDGVWFVPLEPVRDRGLVMPTIARVLGIADMSSRPVLDAIAETIGAGRVLFVLDNFEQVIDAAPVVSELLTRIGGLTVLVSSRAALRVSGEQEFAVPGLPVPPDPERLSEVARLNLPPELRHPTAATLAGFESIRLFVARASAVRSGFTLTDANAPSVAAIVARLHGMPLAIELAAARVKVLAPDQILTRLDRHLALLTAGSRDLPERQQTLRGAIAWSYDLLDPGLRRLMARLSVFVGGCDQELADEVCGPSDELGVDVLDGVSNLLDQSLVRAEDAGDVQRYAMLDSIREYAGEMLAASGEEATIRERHAGAYLALAERAAPELHGADQRMWLDRLEREHDDLRAALDYAADRPDPDPETAIRLGFALWRFWQQRGYLNEARARLERLATRGWDLPPLLTARLAEAAGGIAYWQGDHETAVAWYNRALDAWRAIGDQSEIANALYNASYSGALRMVGEEPLPEEDARSVAMLEEALALYRDLGDSRGEANVVWGLGIYYFYKRDYPTSEGLYRDALRLNRAVGQRTMEGWSLHMLALALIAQERNDEALGLELDAMRIFQDAGDVAGITLALDNLSGLALRHGDEDRAGRLWAGARHLEETTGTGIAQFNASNLLGPALPSAGDVIEGGRLSGLTAQAVAMSLDDLVTYALETQEAARGTMPG